MAKSRKYKDLSKNTLLFTINSFGSKLISFFLVPVYTSVLNTDAFGTTELLASTAQLLIPILTLNIQDAVLRFALEKNRDKQKIFSIGLLINLIGGLVLSMGLFILIRLHIIGLSRTYCFYLFFIYFLGGLNNLISMFLKARNNVSVIVVAGVTQTLIACLTNILFLVVFRFGIIGYMLAQVASQAVSIAIMFFGARLYREISFSSDRTLAREMIIYSLPLIINSTAWWINSASDSFVLTYFWGLAANGIYSVAYKIPTILSTLQSVFYNAWTISAITEFDRNDTDGFIGHIYTLYACISTVGCSVILFLNYDLARILYAKDFFAAWQYVPFLLLGVIFNGIALFEGCLFTAVKETKAVSFTTGMGAVTNVGLNFLLIPFFGAYGAAFATLMGYFVNWLIRTIKLQKIIRMRVDWKRQFLILIIISIQAVLSLFHGLQLLQIPFIMMIVALQFRFIMEVLKRLLTIVKAKRV